MKTETKAKMRDALLGLIRAGEGFAAAVRADTGVAYPWAPWAHELDEAHALLSALDAEPEESAEVERLALKFDGGRMSILLGGVIVGTLYELAPGWRVPRGGTASAPPRRGGARPGRGWGYKSRRELPLARSATEVLPRTVGGNVR